MAGFCARSTSRPVASLTSLVKRARCPSGLTFWFGFPMRHLLRYYLPSKVSVKAGLAQTPFLRLAANSSLTTLSPLTHWETKTLQGPDTHPRRVGARD